MLSTAIPAQTAAHWLLALGLNGILISLAQPLPLAQPPLACLAPRSRHRWIDATAGEDAVLEEMLQRWAAPLHEGGCGNSGRLR